MTYAILGYKAQFALEYFDNKAEMDKLRGNNITDKLLSNASAAFGNASKALGDAADKAKNLIKNISTAFLTVIGCNKGAPEKVDVNDAFDSVQEIDDNANANENANDNDSD